MQISLNGNNYFVYKPQLILETDSCPKFQLLFGHGEYPSVAQQIEFTGSNVEACLLWKAGKLDLQVVGFKDNHLTDNDYPLVITCVVLPKTLQTWFNGGKERDKPLIYQKNEVPAPETGAGFVTRLLGNKVILREEDKSLFDLLFPQNGFATFVQAPKQDNFSFLCHLIEFIRSREPRIKGWAAFQSDGEPLRLVSLMSSKPLELDGQWKPRGAFPTNRYAGKTWAQRDFEVVRRFPTSNPLALLPELVSKGQQKPDEIKGDGLNETDKNQLVMIPGAVKFQGKEYFCRAVTYELTEQPEQEPDISATLTLTDIHTPPKASPLGWQLVNCRFQGWEKSAQEKKYIQLKLENGAVANSEGEADTEKLLYAQVLSPTAPREDCHGFYVKYQPDDSMRCLLIPGSLPTVLGSVQIYNQAFEDKANLVIHAEHIALSGKQVTIEAEDQVSIKGKKVVKMGNKVEVGSD